MRSTIVPMLLIVLILSGCVNAPTATPTATNTPPPSPSDAPKATITLTRTPLPTLTPNGNSAVSTSAVSASASPTVAAPLGVLPSATSALLAAASPDIDLTLRATFIPTLVAGAAGIPPPLTLKLPADWKSTYTLVPLRDQLSEAIMNVAAYAGPVADKGTGFIFILWNFPSITPISAGTAPKTTEELRQQMVLSDGFRLLRGTVIDISCEVGVYSDSFKLAGASVNGQRFQAANCQDGTPDNAGWYVGAWPNNRELLVYAYIEPVSAYNNGRADVQRILDTIAFTSNSTTPSASGITPTPSTPVPPTLTPAPTTTPALY